MTKEEARIFLSINEGDDLSEIYEEQLFTFKLLFTTKPIIWYTFNSKLNKLQKTNDAFETLGFVFPNFTKSASTQLIESEVIMEVFNEFQTKKNQLYLRIYQSKIFAELNYYVLQLMELSHRYSSKWPEIRIDAVDVLLSKESDQMEIFAEIKRIKENGIITFENLVEDKNTEPNCVKKESLRLYLLHQKELEWKRSLPD